jgi:hypothetical protein
MRFYGSSHPLSNPSFWHSLGALPAPKNYFSSKTAHNPHVKPPDMKQVAKRLKPRRLRAKKEWHTHPPPFATL